MPICGVPGNGLSQAFRSCFGKSANQTSRTQAAEPAVPADRLESAHAGEPPASPRPNLERRTSMGAYNAAIAAELRETPASRPTVATTRPPVKPKQTFDASAGANTRASRPAVRQETHYDDGLLQLQLRNLMDDGGGSAATHNKDAAHHFTLPAAVHTHAVHSHDYGSSAGYGSSHTSSHHTSSYPDHSGYGGSYGHSSASHTGGYGGSDSGAGASSSGDGGGGGGGGGE